MKLLTIVIAIIVLLSLVQLTISHSLATDGEKARQLEIKVAQLEKQNRELTEKINSTGSLSKIAQEAEKLGLVKVTQVLHLTPEMPVALGR